MFYYPAVLKRHTGCFSTICVRRGGVGGLVAPETGPSPEASECIVFLTGRLVATRGIKVPRRDFLKVNVKRTCDDIVNYVLEQVPPPRPGLPRPRFSLYLSSQLQYGVIVVYHRQCAILLEELQSIVGQLVKQWGTQKIEMDDQSRQAPILPAALSLMEETEGAPDPLFGVMYLQDAMPSPSTLIQTCREYLREASPERPELARSTTAAAAAAAALDSGITASPETITLKEAEPVAIPIAEFEGVELVDHHPDTLDLLLAQADHFPEGDLEILREVTSGEQDRELERERTEEHLDRERTKELTASTLDLQPTPASSEDATLLPQEEPGLPAEKPGPPTGQVTPVSVPGLPSPPSAPGEHERQLSSLESEAVPPPEVKTKERRRRQLIFFDPVTQLSQEVLQQQIDDPLIETRPPLFPPSSGSILPAADLFNNACTSLPEEVQFLWRLAATVTPVSDSDLQVGERGPESTDSEKEREREMMEMAEREEGSLGLSPKEEPREMAESEMFDISGQAVQLLEGSDQRGSREVSPMYASEGEGSAVSRSAPTLPDIPEGLDELLGREAAESPGLLPEFPDYEPMPVFFQSLLPPEVDRKTVSNIFQRLLVHLSHRKLRVEQSEPYGDILLTPAYHDGEVHLTA